MPNQSNICNVISQDSRWPKLGGQYERLFAPRAVDVTAVLPGALEDTVAGTLYTWFGGTGSPGDPNNWSPTGNPSNGDSALVTAGTIQATDPQLFGNTIYLGAATLQFSGGYGTNLLNPTLDSLSYITTSLTPVDPSATTALTSGLSFAGIIVNDGSIAANNPAGGTLAITVNQYSASGTTVVGDLLNAGTLEVDTGNKLTVTVGSNAEFTNTGTVDVKGQFLLQDATGNPPVAGGLAPVVGNFTVEQGGTLEINTPVDNNIGGQPPYFIVAPGGLLQLDQPSTFNGRILLASALEGSNTVTGTVDLIGTKVINRLIQGSSSTLTLENVTGSSTTVLATLIVLGSSVIHNQGTYSVGPSGGTVDGYSISISGSNSYLSDITGSTDIAQTTGNWSDPTIWSAGVVPGNKNIAVVASSGSGNTTATLNSGSYNVAALLLADTEATLNIYGTLATGGSNYGAAVEGGGTLAVGTSAGSSGLLLVSNLRQLTANTQLTVSQGATVDAVGSNNFAIAIAGTMDVTGVVNAAAQNSNAGGAINVGWASGGDPASVTVSGGGSVSDQYLNIGSDGAGYGAVTLTGAGSSWQDVATPLALGYTSGFAVIGQGGLPGGVPFVADGTLEILAGATMTDSNYAAIAPVANSGGFVDVNSATWNIGTAAGTVGSLRVGDQGSGTLTIENGGVVNTGTGGVATLTNGTSITLDFGVAVGLENGGVGTLTIAGAGSALNSPGGVYIAQFGTASATVSDGGLLDQSGTNTSAGQNLTVGGQGNVPNATGNGTLSVLLDGTVEAGANVGVWAGSTISVDATSYFVIGTAAASVGDIVNSATHALYGDGEIDANIVNYGTIAETNNATNGSIGLSTGGTLTIVGDIQGTGTDYVGNSGLLWITGTVAASETVDFAGSLSAFALGNSGSGLATALTNLSAFDRIELGGLAISSVGTPSSDMARVYLVGGGTYDLTNLSFSAGTQQAFTTGYDGTTGYDYIQVLCYAEGTHIRTPRGDVKIEDLLPGDTVISAFDQKAQSIKWIGRRHVDCTRHHAPETVWPVRVRAGAFGPCLPQRDLHLSRDHALYIEGRLVPVRCLINGESIAQVRTSRVTYYHLELERHDVVWAENLPAETFLDAGNRGAFEGAVTDLHPDFAAQSWEAACAPLLLAGPELEAIRRHLPSRRRAA